MPEVNLVNNSITYNICTNVYKSVHVVLMAHLGEVGLNPVVILHSQPARAVRRDCLQVVCHAAVAGMSSVRCALPASNTQNKQQQHQQRMILKHHPLHGIVQTYHYVN